MTTSSPVRRALLGRAREFAELRSALDRAVAGQSSVFLLSGEGGIGKTRLAEEIAREAQSAALLVFWGRASEIAGASPCWPWLQVLRAAVRTEWGAAFLENDPLGEDLTLLLPRPKSAKGAAPRSDNAELEVLRLGTAIVGLLETLSRERPVVLVFDDLHASDLASLELLQIVARGLRDVRVLVVGTYRELEARRTPKIASLLAKIGREGRIWPLSRLDPQAVAQWLEGVLGVGPARALAPAVFSVTEGNALFVDALAQWLASRGPEASLPPGFALPDSIRETVYELLATVPQDTREVLDAAAVLGRECTLPLLKLVSDRDIEHILAAVGQGTNAGILRAQPQASSQVRFAHILFREALYQALSPSQRVELHARAAAALARLYASNLDAHIAELAVHAFEGAPAGSWLEAADFASRAGHHAMSLFAFDDAAAHFERTLTALDHAESHDDAQRAELLWRLGLCQIRTGQSIAGREACHRASRLAARLGACEIQARAALAAGIDPIPGDIDVRLVELLESALEAGCGNETLRVQVQARLAAAMLPSFDVEKASRLARDAITAARALGDPRVLAEVIAMARSGLTLMDPLEERMGLDRELAALAGTLGNKLLEMRAHVRLVFAAMEQNSPDLVRLELRIVTQLAEETRVPQHRLHAACMRLLWATLRGDAGDIARAEGEVRELAENVDAASFAFDVLEGNRRIRAETCGDPNADFGELLEDPARARTFLPMIHMLLPDRGAAPRAGATGMRLLKRSESRLPCSLRTKLPVFRDRLGERAGTQALYDALLPLERRNSIVMGKLLGFGPFAYELGWLALELGMPDRAIAHFQEALAMCVRSGFTELEACVRRELEALAPADEDDRAAHLAPASFVRPPRAAEWALAQVGTSIDTYRLERLLGIGGMAAVYSAKHRDGERVAIKVLLDRFRQDPDVLRLFRQEASVAKHVGHPGAVPVLAHGVDDGGCAFLVMPLLEGETLGTRWQRANGRLPTSEVAVLMADVLDVLASAHAKGIVHRDIKPDNLFVTKSGHTAVLDFGIARRIDGDGSATIMGKMIGTPAFMPPEQALGNRDAIGPHSDCWAVGATIFALLSSEYVHSAEGTQAQLVAAATRHARSLGRVAPSMSPSVIAFVDKALAFDPAHRWTSATVMRDAFVSAFETALGKSLGDVATAVRAQLTDELSQNVEATLR